MTDICPMTLYRKLFCGCCCLDFGLLIFINTTPLWLTLYTTDEFYLVGLWVVCTSKSCHQLARGVYPDAMRALAVSALIPCFVALLSSWDFLSHFLGPQLPEVLISSIGNSLTGVIALFQHIQQIAQRRLSIRQECSLVD
ncbi:hypothetical protein lerEdw1_009809 [Lerista edwardsae]|nr:hypothetical protein lerEdw1_009809 [Lerista edwardsae]